MKFTFAQVGEAILKAHAADGGIQVFSHDAVAAIMSHALEIAAARGGTMTAEDIACSVEALEDDSWEDTAERLNNHISAQGATVAMLQARVAELEDLLGSMNANYRASEANLATTQAKLTGLREAIDDAVKRWGG